MQANSCRQLIAGVAAVVGVVECGHSVVQGLHYDTAPPFRKLAKPACQ